MPPKPAKKAFLKGWFNHRPFFSALFSSGGGLWGVRYPLNSHHYSLLIAQGRRSRSNFRRAPLKKICLASFQEISNGRTHGLRTPKPKYLLISIGSSSLLRGPLGFGPHSIFDGILPPRVLLTGKIVFNSYHQFFQYNTSEEIPFLQSIGNMLRTQMPSKSKKKHKNNKHFAKKWSASCLIQSYKIISTIWWGSSCQSF